MTQTYMNGEGKRRSTRAFGWRLSNKILLSN